MARCRRISAANYCFHAINRGSDKKTVFHEEDDYDRFVTLIRLANERLPMRILAWCLMPNHFHFVLWPRNEGDMSRWIQWLLTTHVRRHHCKYETSGHVWQGRFKAFPIQQDEHLLTVERYVERNPLRAGLVERAELWPWSSLRAWQANTTGGLLTPGPVERWGGWLRHVNTPQTHAELAAIRNSVNRESPFGDEPWRFATASKLDLTWTLRRPGRPSRRAGMDRPAAVARSEKENDPNCQKGE